jgi:hypothetical protein
VREDELRIAPVIQRLLETGSRPAVVERLVRVYGESMRRVAEMEGNWWHTEIETPLLESGMEEREMMEASHRLSTELASLEEQALLEIYHAQHEHAAMKNVVEDIEGALAKAGVYSRMERLPAVCFLDITGYTRLTEERGDEAAADLAARLSRMVQRTLGPARRQAGQVAGRRGDVLFPGTRSRGPCRARDGRWCCERRVTTSPCRPPRRPCPFPKRATTSGAR